jgi:hypothetical protein
MTIYHTSKIMTLEPKNNDVQQNASVENKDVHNDRREQ